MPIGKYPYMRYRIIDACITNPKKKYPTLEEIKQALAKKDIQVMTRAIERDFETMRHDKRLGFHAPIAYCKINRGYFYTDPDYSLDKLPLSEDDIETFELMVESFKRFKGAQVLNQVQGMLDKLEKVAGQMKQNKTKLNYSPVLFEHVPYNRGIERFDGLYQAIQRRRPLVIHYKKFDHEKGKEHILHPYVIKEYKFRWYLMGYNEKSRKNIILALDRIEDIAPAKIPFVPFKGSDPEKYFDHAIGVTIHAEGAKEIRLWFSPTQGHYIKTQKLHPSQHTISDTREGLVVTLQLIINYELLQTIQDYGPEVKVLEPASLREEIKERLRKTLQLYEA